jgi:hypothetical protein
MNAGSPNPMVAMLVQQNMLLQQQIAALMAQESSMASTVVVVAGGNRDEKETTKANGETPEEEARKAKRELEAKACEDKFVTYLCSPVCCFVDVLTCCTLNCTNKHFQDQKDRERHAIA